MFCVKTIRVWNIFNFIIFPTLEKCDLYHHDLDNNYDFYGASFIVYILAEKFMIKCLWTFVQVFMDIVATSSLL